MAMIAGDSKIKALGHMVAGAVPSLAYSTIAKAKVRCLAAAPPLPLAGPD